MKIDYQIEIAGDFLKVNATGVADKLEDTLQYVEAVIEMAAKHESKKIFCNEKHLKHKLDTFDTVRLAKQIKAAAPRVVRVAVLYDKNELEAGNFYETVTNNRGLFFMITSDYDKAMEWLR